MFDLPSMNALIDRKLQEHAQQNANAKGKCNISFIASVPRFVKSVVNLLA